MEDVDSDEGYVDISSFLELNIKSEPATARPANNDQTPQAVNPRNVQPFYTASGASASAGGAVYAGKRSYSDVFVAPAKRAKVAPQRISDVTLVDINQLLLKDEPQTAGEQANYNNGKRGRLAASVPIIARPSNLRPVVRPVQIRPNLSRPRPGVQPVVTLPSGVTIRPAHNSVQRPDLRTNPFARAFRPPEQTVMANVLRTKPEITLVKLPNNNNNNNNAPRVANGNRRLQPAPPFAARPFNANNVRFPAINLRFPNNYNPRLAANYNVRATANSNAQSMANSNARLMANNNARLIANNNARTTANSNARFQAPARFPRAVQSQRVPAAREYRGATASNSRLQPTGRLNNVGTQQILPARGNVTQQGRQALCSVRGNSALTLTRVARPYVTRVDQPHLISSSSNTKVVNRALLRYPYLIGHDLQPIVRIERLPGERVGSDRSERRLYCHECARAFTRPQDLRAHNLAKHTSRYRDGSGSSTSRNNRRRSRNNTPQSRNQPRVKVECEICFQILSSTSSLRRHMYTHRDLLDLKDVTPPNSDAGSLSLRDDSGGDDALTGDASALFRLYQPTAGTALPTTPLVQFPTSHAVLPTYNVLDDLANIDNCVEDLFKIVCEQGTDVESVLPTDGSEMVELSDGEADYPFIDPSSLLEVECLVDEAADPVTAEKTPLDELVTLNEDAPLDDDLEIIEDAPLVDSLANIEDAPLVDGIEKNDDTPLEVGIKKIGDAPLDNELEKIEDAPLDNDLEIIEDTPLDNSLTMIGDAPLDDGLEKIEDTLLDDGLAMVEDTPLERIPTISEDAPLDQSFEMIEDEFATFNNMNVDETDEELLDDSLTLKCQCCEERLPTMDELVAHLKNHINDAAAVS